MPKKYINYVYPEEKFGSIEFVYNLTGYVPFNIKNFEEIKSIREREFIIGYRGRELPYWYGSLGYEKFIIGKKMHEICSSRNIKVNIEWESDKRIYGDGWFKFIENCRAVLGTESGSNVFDFYGEIEKEINKMVEEDPNIEFNEIYEKLIKEKEKNVKMNQISPKIFEAISLKTVLILFEGEYSGVIKPNIHYIPLKKDFSNVDEILKKLEDIEYLKNITERAYKDVIESGNYSYKKFVSKFDEIISLRKYINNNLKPIFNLSGYHDMNDNKVYNTHKYSKKISERSYQMISESLFTKSTEIINIPYPVKRKFLKLKSVWFLLPESVKKNIYPFIKLIRYVRRKIL